MKTKIINWLAILLILETGLIHLLTAQGEYEEAPYLGYLFVANFLIALVAAYGIYRQTKLGWYIGLGLAGATLGGYIWSRTAGMPGMEVEEWLTPWGIASMIVETLFIGLFAFRTWKISTLEQEVASDHPWLKNLAGAALISMLILITSNVYFWDQGAFETSGMAGMSVDMLKNISWISEDELSQKYGVQVSRVAIIAMDSIVDVRIKVIDPEKATKLLKNHPAMFVDQSTLIESPNMHRHGKLTQGQTLVLFFTTFNHTVKTGSLVSLIFGNVLLQPQTVR